MRYIINRLNNKLSEDLATKLISVFLGIILWFIVLNINNPYIEKKFYIELDVRNENTLQEKNIYLVNKNYRRTVEVVVQGRQSTLDSLSSADFEAVLDFSKVRSVNDKSIKVDDPYYTKNDKQITITGMSPKEIPIELEHVLKKELPVMIELKGTPKQSYMVIKTATKPEYVSLHDRESLINTVSSVKAVVDINGIDRDKKVINQSCTVYNTKGEEISSLSNQFTVDIVLEVGKEVPIEPVITGEPAADHVISGIKVNAPNAVITGSYDIISKITSLSTETINVDGLTAAKDYKVPIKLSEGVKLYNTEADATVAIEVEKLEEREIVISKMSINIENVAANMGNMGNNSDNGGSQLKYEILTDSCKVILKGRTASLNNINPSILTPHIDVEGLQEGVHHVQLKVSPSPDIDVIKLPSVEVKITKVKNEKPPEENTNEDGRTDGKDSSNNTESITS
ncbi:MAG TPA: CdaR family protein [Clostridiales bacterium]|nr:CdaR family protein [Clostridiales bacterium]